MNGRRERLLQDPLDYVRALGRRPIIQFSILFQSSFSMRVGARVNDVSLVKQQRSMSLISSLVLTSRA